MIKTEFRIGNLVEYPGWNNDGSKAYFQIRDIFFDDNKIALTNGIIQLPGTKLDYIKPVELDIEFFVKHKISKATNNGFYISVPKIKAEIHFEKTGLNYVCVVYCSTGVLIPNDIKYAHQLQNLFFSIVGEELVFSTEP